MSVEVRLCETDNGAWDDYVDQVKRASFFHQWAYRQVVAQTFGHWPCYLAAFQGEEIRGLLPLFAVQSWLFSSSLVSLPFVDYGGICAEEAETEQALLQEAVRIARREQIQTIELRHQHPNALALPTKLDKVNLVLPLDPDSESMWKGLDAKVRNQVRKAMKSGLEFEVGGLEKLPSFYQVWSSNMRDLGTPAYPLAFFRHFLEAFSAESEVLLVAHRGQPVGGGIAVYFKDTMEVPWASSLRAYFPYCPNNLLYWEAIKRGCERGCREFHFGRSTKGSGNYRFKKQWGAEDQQLYYQCYSLDGGDMPDLDPRNPKYRLAVALWKRLPVAVANLLGPHIIRGIP